jgi:sialate O-acetylesterase
MFTDHMVLQRQVPCPISGKAKPNAAVEALIDGKRVTSGTADEAGEFKLKLPALNAPGPYKIEIRSGEDVAVLNDVLAGEVWLCAGQSNMEWPTVRAVDGPQEVAKAKHPTIRLFTVPRAATDQPATAMDAKWEVCSPETVAQFSAVAYFYGRHLQGELNVRLASSIARGAARRLSLDAVGEAEGVDVFTAGERDGAQRRREPQPGGR